MRKNNISARVGAIILAASMVVAEAPAVLAASVTEAPAAAEVTVSTETAEETATEAAEESTEETTEETTEESTEETAEEVTEESTEETTEEATAESTEETAEETAKETTEEAAEETEIPTAEDASVPQTVSEEEIPVEETETNVQEPTVTTEAGDVDALGAKIVTPYSLSDVTGFTYDSNQKMLYWNKVKNATYYKLTFYYPADYKDASLAGKEAASGGTSDLYYNPLNAEDDDGNRLLKDVNYTVKIKAYNYDELYVVATGVSGTDIYGGYDSDDNYIPEKYESGKDYDTKVTNTTITTDANGVTTTTYTYDLYKRPTSINEVGTTALLLSTDKTITQLTSVSVKEIKDGYVYFKVNPTKLQTSEKVKYEYSNNKEFKNNKTKGWFAEEDDSYNTDSLGVPLSDFQSGDTMYVRARVYNYNFSLEAGQTEENLYSNYVTTTYKVPSAEMGSVSTTVTGTSIRLVPYANGVTGYQYQRKDGKKWVDLGKTSDDYTDKGLKKNTKYNYRVRGYVYNKQTKKNSYTDWKEVSAYTWGSALNVKASAASSTSVKLTWKKVSGAEGYEIYRVDTSSGNYNKEKGEGIERFENATLIKTLKKDKSVKYTDKKLKKNNAYQYVVRAYRTVGKNKTYIEGAAYITLGKKGVINKRYYYDSKGAKVVTWNKLTGISGIKVEKYNPATGKYEKYKTLKKTATSVKLPKVSAGGKEVDYRIYTYSGKKVLNETFETVEPRLAAVKNVKAKVTSDGVKVTWDKVSGADYYRVYRCTKDAVSYDKTTKMYDRSGGTLVYTASYDASGSADLTAKFKDTEYQRYGYFPVKESDVKIDEYGDKYYVDAEGNPHTVYGNATEGYEYYGKTAKYTKYDYNSIQTADEYGYSDGDYLYNVTTSEDEICQIKGTSVVDKDITVKKLISKEDVDGYDKNADSEYIKELDKYTGDYGKYAKDANGTLLTEDAVIVKGPDKGAEYYYFVEAVAEPSNGKNGNDDITVSAGFTKGAKAVYTKVTAKAAKLDKVKSSKKATVTVGIKKVSGAKGYAVYRSTSKNGTYTKVGNTTGKSYTDTGVTGGKTYYYKVASYKYSENGTYVYSKLSSAKKIKVKK